jgi:drug/metabolite transporter (DMT)-like permease
VEDRALAGVALLAPEAGASVVSASPARSARTTGPIVGELLALLGLVLFSCNVFVVRAAAARLEQGLGFLVALVANVLAAALAVLGQVLVTGSFARPPWQAVALFLLGGVFANYLGRRGYFRSVELIGPSRAAAIQVTNPAFALALAWGLLGETVSGHDLLAVLAVLGGLVLASLKPTLRRGGPAGQPPRMRGTRLLPMAHLVPALVAALCYGLGNVVRSAGVRQWEEPLVGGLLGALAGTAAYLALHVRVRTMAHRLRAADRRGLVLWVFAGTLAIGGQVAVIAATVHIEVGIAVAISSALPVLVIPVSVLLLRNTEGVTPPTVVGSGLILAGVVAMLVT